MNEKMIDNYKSPKTTTVGILGAGYISDFHYNALRLLPEVKVQAICDLNYRLAEQFAQANGIPKIYSDLDQMLESEQLDAVHVLTPPQIHYTTSSKIIEAGIDILIEKPFCHTVNDCQKLSKRATELGRTIGISHNFLYFPVYEQLLSDFRSGRLGTIDQIDIVWNKELGQLKGGPFSAWMLQNPKNILFEVCPHSFAHLIHLIGQPDSISVELKDKIILPTGLEFYRLWEIKGWKDNISIRIRFSFIDGYPEHYIAIRATNGIAKVDFENNLYTYQEHTPYMLDVDRYLNVINPAKNSIIQANKTLKDFVLSKMGLSKMLAPFPNSIARTVASFYQTRESQLDERIHPTLGEAAVVLAARIAQEVDLLIPNQELNLINKPLVVPTQKSTVLVIGGTGFIGKALVRKLNQNGYGVRVIARNPDSCSSELKSLGIELVKGDFTDTQSIEDNLDGIEYVYHLARANGKTWSDYLQYDVKPTIEIAELCLKYQIRRLFYTSSIAIYYAGKNATTITEATPPHSGIIRSAPYARSKVENENLLLKLHQNQGLPIVIFRPGIVLGRGGSPYHWGIAGWPYNSVPCILGNGNHPLPIILVDDVAEAMVKAITVSGIEGESYNLTSNPGITANDYLDELENRAKIKFKRVYVSPGQSYIESMIKWTIKSIGGNRDVAFPSFAECEGRSFSASFDSSKAEQELGWFPIKDRETIIKEGIYIPVDEFLI